MELEQQVEKQGINKKNLRNIYILYFQNFKQLQYVENV